MDVVFRRTGERRYEVEAKRTLFPDVAMNPAPGFDPEVPHDLVHFVVEAELELTRGVFGQLAAGGNAGGFRHDREPAGSAREASRRRRRADRRGQKLMREGRAEAELSERAGFICWYEWLARSSSPENRKRARAMRESVDRVRTECSDAELEALSPEVVSRVCSRLDDESSRWVRLRPGQSMTVPWPFPEHTE